MTYVYATNPVFGDECRGFLSFRSENSSANSSELVELTNRLGKQLSIPVFALALPIRCHTVLDMPSGVIRFAGLCVLFGRTLYVV